MAQSAGYWIEKLQLQPHPEGGFYRVSYEAAQTIAQEALPQSFKGKRRASTAIFFLLQKGDFSAFHRIPSDELWHFYAGDSLSIYMIAVDGQLQTTALGSDIEKGQTFQAVVPAGCWFASEPTNKASYALVGCTVAPGFDFADFELANRSNLENDYPQHKALIERLTR